MRVRETLCIGSICISLCYLPRRWSRGQAHVDAGWPSGSCLLIHSAHLLSREVAWLPEARVDGGRDEVRTQPVIVSMTWDRPPRFSDCWMRRFLLPSLSHVKCNSSHWSLTSPFQAGDEFQGYALHHACASCLQALLGSVNQGWPQWILPFHLGLLSTNHGGPVWHSFCCQF